VCTILEHGIAPINLQNKALVGELCRFGGEIHQITAKKSKTRTYRALATECPVRCKSAQLTRMVVDSMVSINNTIGRQVVMVLWVTHYMSGFVRIFCTVNKCDFDNYMVGSHLTHATACVRYWSME